MDIVEKVFKIRGQGHANKCVNAMMATVWRQGLLTYLPNLTTETFS